MKFALFLTAFMLNLPQAFSHELCALAGLKSLTLTKLHQGEARNSCLISNDQLTLEEITVLSEVIELHQNVAAFFKVSAKDLFLNPIELDISEGVFGPFSSIANGKGIYMGSFPGDGFRLNRGVYLHELGHVITKNPNTKLPPILKDLDFSLLFSESFSDLLALSLQGEIISPISTKPICLDRLRYISTSQTYNYPLGYFQNFSEARIRKCCDSLDQGYGDLRISSLCEAAREWFGSEVDLSKPFPGGPEALVDDHQLGLPVLSFLRNLSTKLGKPLKKVFEQMFISNEAASKDSYLCKLRKNENLIHSEITRISTVKTILQDYYKNLDSSGRKIFSGLFKKHALEKGFRFSEPRLLENIKIKYLDKMKDTQMYQSQCLGIKDCTSSCELSPL